MTAKCTGLPQVCTGGWLGSLESHETAKRTGSLQVCGIPGVGPAGPGPADAGGAENAAATTAAATTDTT